MGPVIKPMTHPVPSFSSLCCKEPGPQSCWVPWEHPKRMPLAARAPAVSVSVMSVISYCLSTGPTSLQWHSGQPCGWRGAGECGPLAPTSIALDGTPAYPDLTGMAGQVKVKGESLRNVSGVSQPSLAQVKGQALSPSWRKALQTSLQMSHHHF